MRFLSVNHLRLGARPGGIPEHLSIHHGLSTRDIFARIVDHAIREHVHAVFLTGETFSAANDGLEALGALEQGLGALDRAGIPVVAVEHGRFTPDAVEALGLGESVKFVDGQLDWHPPILTSDVPVDGPAIHILGASLTEEPGDSLLTMEQVDQPGAIWLLTNPRQPDMLQGQHALVIEPGSPAPLSSSETGRHGVWLIDTDAHSAELVSTAAIEFASIGIDVANADDLGGIERMVVEHITAYADAATADGSVAETILADVTLTGTTRLYAAIPDFATELSCTVQVEHKGTTIAVTAMNVDVTPAIDLEPLLGRPDPVGELARLITALDSGSELPDSQRNLMALAEQRLLAVRHARVFGSIHDDDLLNDTETVLKRQAWAMLDSLVRQRGID